MSFATSISSGDTSDTDRFLPFGPGPPRPLARVLLYQLRLCPVKKRSPSMAKGHPRLDTATKPWLQSLRTLPDLAVVF